MIIDLHIHSKNCSDGNLTVEEIVKEAKIRNIGLISITDHDSIDCQERAMDLAKKNGIRYISGVELNIAFSHPKYQNGKMVSLDLLGYQFDVKNKEVKNKLQQIARYREKRVAKIFDKINAEFEKEGIEKLTKKDLKEIQVSVDGVLGRPHVADYLIKKRIVRTKQEAFDRYLVKCDVPKYPLYPEEASRLMRNAGGIVVLAHPNDPQGTSLVTLTKSLPEQTKIIEESLLGYIDGVECWHSRNDALTTNHYVKFAKKHELLATGGSDCHQKPIIMGTVEIPEYVTGQFSIKHPLVRKSEG
ncbi:MAG: PHP domain-containing protein [Candidatus Bathyarchaeota archaeon]|nr:PHP domain-containing protein [Candidatus Bathyarchaeota archaeon]MDH5788384.1 PHP domain-containing protein [Candidatus Bathyarchaeota archaeon]